MLPDGLLRPAITQAALTTNAFEFLGANFSIGRLNLPNAFALKQSWCREVFRWAGVLRGAELDVGISSLLGTSLLVGAH
jgi:hypothetical protein